MKQTITTGAHHGLSKGDAVTIGGETFTVTGVQETTFDVRPMNPSENWQGPLLRNLRMYEERKAAR